MSDIFISYRRGDSEDATGRIRDRLCDAFGEERIFIDIDDIPIGVDFRQLIDREVSRCRVLLAVIGPDWLEAGNERRQRRLDDPADFVRIEIESALQREIPIVPVLVRRASMPREEDLPDSLKPLVFRHAVRVRADSDFTNDVGRLIRGLQRHLKEQSSLRQSAAPKAKSKHRQTLRSGEVVREPLKDGGVGPEMVVIPGGRFLMGSPETEPGRQRDEGPRHEVVILPFALGKFPLTFDAYDRFAEATGAGLPNDEGWGRGNRPVINVSWNDAVACAAWLGEQAGHRYRLPTEAEWEYAARAGTTTRYCWGDEIDCGRARYGYYSNECGKQRSTDPVGMFAANSLGLHDMHGNIWEWTLDCWHANYEGAPVDGSAWLEADSGECSLRVVRGGGWKAGGDFLRSSSRGWVTAVDAANDLGFRLARDL